MTRSISILASVLNLAMFGAFGPPRERTRGPRDRRPEKVHREPRRFRHEPEQDAPGM
jgi:hypothetical protein